MSERFNSNESDSVVSKSAKWVAREAYDVGRAMLTGALPVAVVDLAIHGLYPDWQPGGMLSKIAMGVAVSSRAQKYIKERNE